MCDQGQLWRNMRTASGGTREGCAAPATWVLEHKPSGCHLPQMNARHSAPFGKVTTKQERTHTMTCNHKPEHQEAKRRCVARAYAYMTTTQRYQALLNWIAGHVYQCRIQTATADCRAATGRTHCICGGYQERRESHRQYNHYDCGFPDRTFISRQQNKGNRLSLPNPRVSRSIPIWKM
jgi:hypothetical protein